MTCAHRNTGGKGNVGMFIERDPKICAAGAPSAQEEQTVAGCFNWYSLQDEVDALIHDAIIPEPKPCKLPPLKNAPVDLRNAGIFTEARDLINPPVKKKYEILVDDFKDTVYSSYWKKRLGTFPDPVPMLPAGFDYGTTLGQKLRRSDSLYDVVMPKNPIPDKTPAAKEPAYQTTRNYNPLFNPNRIFGKPFHQDSRGILMKTCLSDDRVLLGIPNIPIETRHATFMNTKQAVLGKTTTPNHNISYVPQGHTFGKMGSPDNDSPFQMSQEKELFYKCLQHLNTLRKGFKKRFTSQQFADFYLQLKYSDKSRTGWLPKEHVYKYCSQKYIRINPLLLEPLLTKLNAFDGNEIEYKIFIKVINHTEPMPDLPKVWDSCDKLGDYRTTYSEMVKPDQAPYEGLVAGRPSGKYFDKENLVTTDGALRKARISFETEAKSCLNPSVFTQFGVIQEDMYLKRDPAQVRQVFEAAGEIFSDEKFDRVWNSAKKEHTQECVCYESFSRALDRANKIEGK